MNAPYIVYSDGACSGNPGPGGWAWVSLAGGEIREGYGGEPATTNNRMELIGATEALAAIKARVDAGELKPGLVEVRTDSQYVKNGVTSWIASWKRNGWRTASKQPVKNRDLWERLDALSRELAARWVWVEGHAGEAWNERCDELARRGVAENR
ncbi:MAG TPA: ribonuclease HI [Spirochaetales bacterium]|nr:ribonuclease HI [Spirochaetales bacterium]HPM71991.1 ribonuclease HI [Spirochaetales bacterium]